MIKITNVYKTYSNKYRKNTALSDVSLKIPNKGITFIIGKSGSGKTTLLNLMSGLDNPTTGLVEIDGKDTSTLSDRELSEMRSYNIGFIFQNTNLIERWTVRKNIEFGLKLLGKKISKEKIDDVISLLELYDCNGNSLADEIVANLSGGQKQRVGIARAIVKDPKYIFADEPTGSLDSQNSENIINILRKISKHYSVVIVTHNKDIIKQSDYVIELVDGQVANKDNCDIEFDETTENKAIVKAKKNKITFSIANNFLFKKKGKLVFSTILCFFSSFFFTLPFIGIFQNSESTHLNTIDSNQVAFMYVVGKNELIIPDNYNSEVHGFSQEQKEAIETYNGFENLYVSNSSICNLAHTFKINDEISAYEDFVITSFMYSAELPLNFDYSLIGLEKDSRVSSKIVNRMPNVFNEIAISSIQADYLLEYGYCDNYDDNPETFDSINNLIGKKLGEFKICGIFSSKTTNIELPKNFYECRSADFSLAEGNYIEKCSYVLKGQNNYDSDINIELLDSYNVPSMAIIANKGAQKVKKLIQSNDYKIKNSWGLDISFDLDIASPFTELVYSTEFLTTREWLISMFILSVVFGLIGFFLTQYMLLMDFEINKKELGTILAVGASKKCIREISFYQSVFIGFIGVILSAISSIILCSILNSIFIINAFIFYPWIPLITLAYSFLIAFLSVITVFVKINKTKAIDLIKEI